MKFDEYEIAKNLSIPERVFRFRNQALCIKTNVQVLKDIWNLQPNFKEKNTGAFYQIIQDNCIFRIVLESYKLLYDTMKGSTTIRKMANDCYREMIEMEEFSSKQQELLCIKKNLSSDLSQFADVEKIVKSNRNRVYAHNDQEYHWFSESYTKFWGMTDEIYDRILEVSNICIEYCNIILEFFNKKPVYEYSNHDDVKRLFGMKTEKDVEIEGIRYLIYGES